MKTLITILCCFIPFKKLRRQLKIKYVKSNRIIYRNNNRVIIHMPGGQIVTNPYSIPELNVLFNGHDSTIELFYPIKFHKSRFVVCDNCKITIKSSGFMGINIDMYHNSSVFIDEHSQIGECAINMANEMGTELHIGKDCMFSTGIEIWTTDTHPIFDNNGKCINNAKAHVNIGNHVWVCRKATLLKGTQIPDNCIIGNSAVCTSRLPLPNCIYAGNPCKCVKQEITWRGDKFD